MANLLQELRNATRDQHEEIDLLVTRRFRPESPSFQKEYLARFHEGLSRCWPMLDWEKLVRLGLPGAARRKERYLALDRDVESLGIRPSRREDHHDSAASVSVGCLYVLEGSIHGGRMLAPAILRQHPEGDGLEFLNGFGPDNPAMWRAFIDWLQSLDADGFFISDASAAASAAFRHIMASFDPDQWTIPTHS